MPISLVRSARQPIIIALFAAMAGLVTSPVAAQTTSWTGAVDTNWSTTTAPTNWNPGIPTTNSTIQFDAGSLANLNTNNDLTGLALTGINVTAVPGTAGANPVSIGGNGFSLGTGGIAMGTATQNLTIGLTAGQSVGLTGAQSWTVAAGRTLQVNSPIVDGASAGLLTLTGSGTAGIYAINGANTYTGGTFIAGTQTNVQIGSSTVLGGGGAIVSGPFGTGNVTWSVNSIRPSAVGGPRTLANSMSIQGMVPLGTNNLQFDGPIQLTAATTTINNQMTQAGGTTDQTAFILNGTITTANLASARLTLEYQSPAPGAAITIINGAIQESPGQPASVVMASTGNSGPTVRVSGANNYSAGTTIQGNVQVVQIGVNTVGSFGSITSGPFGKGTVSIGNTTGTKELDAFGADRIVANDFTDGGMAATIFGGSNSLTLSGPYTLINRARTLTNNLPAGKVLTFGGTFFTSEATGTVQRVPTFNGTGATVVAGAITPQGTGAAAGITKTGTGSLNLTNNNLYGGTTTISGGLLSANNTPVSGTDSATGSGAVNVTSTGILGGSGQITGTITISTATAIAASGTIAPGNSAGTLSVGSMVWNRFGQFNFEHNATLTTTGAGVNDFVTGMGTLDLSNLGDPAAGQSATPFKLNLAPLSFQSGTTERTYTLATFALGFTGTVGGTAGTQIPDQTDVSNLFSLSGVFLANPAAFAKVVGTPGGVQSLQLTFTPVPEPSSILLVCGGIAGLAGWRRRRREA